MSRYDLQPGARRRAIVRGVLGRPGSLRRWILGSLVWLSLCLAVFLVTGNLFVMLFAVLLDTIAFFARSSLVGDEDELHAQLRRDAARVIREGSPADDDMLTAADAAEWFSRSTNRFDDVPPPPVAGEDE